MANVVFAKASYSFEKESSLMCTVVILGDESGRDTEEARRKCDHAEIMDAAMFELWPPVS